MGVLNQYHLYLLQLFSIADDQLPQRHWDSVQDHPGSHRLLATRPIGSSAEG
ncbi:hypothetical protein M422DRAFT_38164 [Sphaerobolus stellatus SS14]|uniref:Uncharacterized protein n=1 Tax=Sphaerobolus stellatus (strain SS14) TaxID=990650 RepID=A0A0C9TBQ6_SPHS4|nr:hypothetical protein M422DRAFT_38164 [Sphaerobolus stellatus SS14]